jgi:allantoin racemase
MAESSGSAKETKKEKRIWYQSFVHPLEQKPYIERLQAYLDQAAAPGSRFEVHGLDPPDRHFHPLTEFRCAAQTIRNALEAERSGYDALVIGHFQEPGLLQIRGALDIPVIGLGEASLLAALTMGGRLGLVTIDPAFVDWHERQIAAHCLGERVAGVRALQMDLPGFMRAFTDEASYAQVRADFVEQVRPLVASGAEVILPAGGLPMLLFARECPFVIDGALVLNGVAVAVKTTEMALALRELTGAVVSRRGTYAKASPACIDEYLNGRW